MTFAVTLKVVLMSCREPVAEPFHLKDLLALESLEKAISGIEGGRRSEISQRDLLWGSASIRNRRQTGDRKYNPNLFRNSH